MIIYNITIKIYSSIHNDWIAWLKEEHVPDILNTGCFTKAHTLRLLETDDTDGPTYAIQYYAESRSLYNRYIEKFSAIMHQKSFDKWGDKFIAFNSLLEIVN